ncbi:Glycine N-acyltransferase-like protein 3 [Nibea albiflora]|uniref:Glycine N-acyltransferase-like protein 3 n=1 Tax=Nibea albiflora TaxID=240163 RepID=A0ACB7EDR4_NIBAL|nr:Glycine N-acyltransferase-like protein 3 [Nibea albiflora]
MNAMWKIVLPLLAAVYVVSSQKLMGGFNDIDVNDEGVQNALNFAVVKHNRESNAVCPSQVSRVVKATRQVYGFLHGINRNKPTVLEVLVDRWPDFNVIICRPDPKNKHAREFMKKVTYYSTDAEVLRKVLTEENAFDWRTYFVVGGFDFSHSSILKEVSSHREVNNRVYTLVHLLYLPDISQLLTPAIDSELESRISSLSLSHVDLVNKTWKFGGNKQGFKIIQNLIGNFPSCCITDAEGQPVSWILVYDYCAMGILYTLPEHRGKGYAKVLVSTMAKRLHTEGYPVYCFIEEENVVSYKLFKNLGFTEDPSYRAAWFEFNF